MRVAVTGTPGTGKTSAVEALEDDPEFAAYDLDVVHLNDLIREEDLWADRDEERDSLVADLDAVRGRFEGRDDLLVESHLAHHLDADRVVVLRCHPEELERRLRERGEPEAKAKENAESVEPSRALARKARENAESVEPSRALARKARENAESEALDVILTEAVNEHGVENVYEIETTDRAPDDVAAAIRAVLAGERDPSAGEVDYLDYL